MTLVLDSLCQVLVKWKQTNDRVREYRPSVLGFYSLPPNAPSFFSIPSSSLSPPSSTNWLPGVGWFWKSSSHIHTMLHHASFKISLHTAVLTWLVDSFHGSLRACNRKNYRHYCECPDGVQSAFWLSAIIAKTIVNPKQKKASKEQTRTRLKLADCFERRKKNVL